MQVIPISNCIVWSFLVLLLTVFACRPDAGNDGNAESSERDYSKPVVYQMMVRLFGNTTTTNRRYGTAGENGVGKFDDITAQALIELRKLGITHVWYTGVLEHATMTDYSHFGIEPDDPDVVKGRAGSPYAIRDYYDVSPDLAVDVPGRREEFRDLVERSHEHGLKVIIDFVPNHVARTYRSDTNPGRVTDLGQSDDPGRPFSPDNNFYYLPGQDFRVPENYDPLPGEVHPLKDGKFHESPAKATGNDVFAPQPSINDWFETIKLNYGVDYSTGKSTHFDPIPDTWFKMADILKHWAALGVDGFRCDMAEMVPVEFWEWAISGVKAAFPGTIFIAEIYNPDLYEEYIHRGGFDFLYDKVQLYDSLRNIVAGRRGADGLPDVMRFFHDRGIDDHMLRFLENHDEQRIASPYFAGDPWKAWPAMVVSATVSNGPVMIYFGQEVGEPGAGDEGFQGEDGRTTIFDYWGVPEHQKWLNGGKYDGGLLSIDQHRLRKAYGRLLSMCNEFDVLGSGRFFDLHAYNLSQAAGYRNSSVYSFLRSTQHQHVAVIANFSDSEEARLQVLFPPEILKLNSIIKSREALNEGKSRFDLNGNSNTLYVQLAPLETAVLVLDAK